MTDEQSPAERRSTAEIIQELLARFETSAQADEDGVQYWRARPLSILLGYKRWENFAATTRRAKAACENVGEPVEDHFREATKMVTIGSGAERPQTDYELTRFACYLIALNGDPEKPEIAAAQTYFTVQTRRQEIADIAASEPRALSEDDKRVLLRDELKTHNRALASAAKAAGVVQPQITRSFKMKATRDFMAGWTRAESSDESSCRLNRTSSITCPAAKWPRTSSGLLRRRRSFSAKPSEPRLERTVRTLM